MKSPLSVHDQYRIYSKFLKIYSKLTYSVVGKRKVLREVQSKHDQPEFKTLYKDFTSQQIAKVLTEHLRRGVFESKEKAHSLFSASVRSYDADGVEIAEEGRIQSTPAATPALLSKKNSVEVQDDSANPDSNTAPAASTYLAFPVQHQILTFTQRQLEDCVFKFSTKWLPKIAAERSWDCPEAVELHKATSTLLDLWSEIPVEALLPPLSDALKRIFDDLEEVRHSAVHRRRLDLRSLGNLVDSASRAAQTLGDRERIGIFCSVQKAIQKAAERIDVKHRALRHKLEEERGEVLRLRQLLDKREETVIRAVTKEALENRASVSSFLETELIGIASPGLEEKSTAPYVSQPAATRSTSLNLDECSIDDIQADPIVEESNYGFDGEVEQLGLNAEENK